MKTPGEIFVDQIKHNPAMQMAVVAAGANALRQQREHQEAVRREAEAARKETEAMRKEIERMRDRAEKAEQAQQRARERVEKLSQDRDIVFGMAKQIESLAARPLVSPQEVRAVRYEYQQHANTLKSRGIGVSTFERFEDKEFYTRLKQQMDELGQRIKKESARVGAEERRALVIESLGIVDRIAAEQASAASYLKLEQHAAYFAEKNISSRSFADASDRALLQDYEEKLAAERARQLDAMPRESLAAMSELKSWLRFRRVLDQHRPRAMKASDDIELCQKHLASVPVPEPPKTFLEVASRTPRFVAPLATIVALWFVVLVLVILQRTGENAHYGTWIALGFLISGLTTFLLLAILSPFKTVSMKVGEMQVDFASTQKRTKRLLSQLEDLQRAKAEGARKFGEELAEVTGIAGDTLEYAAALTFPSAESTEFRKSAEAYCEQLCESLGIHQSMIPVLESAAAIPG